MNASVLELWLTVVGTACWVACFWWMHRISSRQNTLLGELREQGRRIEALSREEHALIREVHPQVSEIKESIDAVAADVAGRR